MGCWGVHGSVGGWIRNSLARLGYTLRWRRRWGRGGAGLRAHPARLTAEAIAHRPLAAHQTSPQPCAMRDAIIITLDLDPNASAPHGVTPVQPLDRPLKRKPQTPHGILGVNRNGMAAVRMRVQLAHHGFHGDRGLAAPGWRAFPCVMLGYC